MIVWDQTPATDILVFIQRANPRLLNEARLPDPIAEPRLDIRINISSAESFEVHEGEYIQIIDVQGRQCSDFLAFNRRALDRGDSAGPQLDDDAVDDRRRLSQARALFEVFRQGSQSARRNRAGYGRAARHVQPRVHDPLLRGHGLLRASQLHRQFQRRAQELSDRQLQRLAGHQLLLQHQRRLPQQHLVRRAVVAARRLRDDARADGSRLRHLLMPFRHRCFQRLAPDRNPRSGLSERHTLQARDRIQNGTGCSSPADTRIGISPAHVGPHAQLRRIPGLLGAALLFAMPGRSRSTGRAASARSSWIFRRCRKMEVLGPDAEQFLQGIITRDVRKLSVGQIYYTPMCYEHGGMVDDGTLFRLAENNFRWIGGDDASLIWLKEQLAKTNYKVTLKTATSEINNVAVQGPKSREILQSIIETPPGRPTVQELGLFRFTVGRIGGVAGIPVLVSRTGYTGELGYEVFCHPKDAPAVWDEIMAAGAPFGIQPFGFDALDMVRIEAGLVFGGHDFNSTTDPLEAGIGFTVPTKKEEDYIGKAAIEKRRANPLRKLVGLEIAGQREACARRSGFRRPRASRRGDERDAVAASEEDAGIRAGRRHAFGRRERRSRSDASTACRSASRQRSCRSHSTIPRRSASECEAPHISHAISDGRQRWRPFLHLASDAREGVHAQDSTEARNVQSNPD